MKKVIGIVIYLTLLVIIAGCGNTSTFTALASYPEDSHDTEAIESDELTESVQQEESKVNTIVQSVSYGSGNFEDYWEGDSYFDIVGFAEANGCTKIFWYDADNNKCDINSSSINRIVFFYGDWHIFVYMNQIQVFNTSTNEVHSMVSTRDTNTVSICNQNDFKIYSDVPQGFNDILEEIKSN